MISMYIISINQFVTQCNAHCLFITRVDRLMTFGQYCLLISRIIRINSTEHSVGKLKNKRALNFMECFTKHMVIEGCLHVASAL